MVSSSANSPQQAGRSPFLLVALVAGFLCVVTLLPRVVLTAGGVEKARALQTNSALTPPDDRLTTLARVERLMESRVENDVDAAGRLMDGLSGDALVISDTDSVGEQENSGAFSSSTLLAKIARQCDLAAARAIGSKPRATPGDTQKALQWTQRARRIADALMLSPRPSFAALKAAHYLDAIAGKREAAALRAGGNTADARATERQNTLLQQLWNNEIKPVMERDELKRYANDRAGAATDTGLRLLTDAEWEAQVEQIVVLYRNERPFLSQA